MENQRSSERNSPLRKLKQTLLGPLVEQLINLTPPKFWPVLPDLITLISTLGFSFDALWQAVHEADDNDKNKWLNFLDLIAWAVGDALDGEVARKLKAMGVDRSNNQISGELVDTLSDRVQELAIALALMIKNAKQGDQLGTMIAGFIGLLNPLTSTLRAKAASLGQTVPETGRNPLQFLGTRAGAAFFLSMALTIKETRLPAELATAAAKLSVIRDRFKAVLIGKKKRKSSFDILDEDNNQATQLTAAEMIKAEKRFRVLWPVALVSGIISVIASIYALREISKKR